MICHGIFKEPCGETSVAPPNQDSIFERLRASGIIPAGCPRQLEWTGAPVAPWGMVRTPGSVQHPAKKQKLKPTGILTGARLPGQRSEGARVGAVRQARQRAKPGEKHKNGEKNQPQLHRRTLPRVLVLGRGS